MENAQEIIARYDEDIERLRRIGEAYGSSSPEGASIRRAAMALSFAVMKHRDLFAAFLDELYRPLSAEEKAHLRSLGHESAGDDET